MMTLLPGCHRGGRIISKGALENIYVDMFLADQWLRSDSDARRKADTTLFYEPIFRRYGYTSKDFDATISYYTDRPDKFVKILHRSAKTLNEKYLEYNRIAERLQRINMQDKDGYGYVESAFADADSILWGTTVLDSILVRDSVYIKEAPADTLEMAAAPEEVIQTEIINVTGRDSVRPHKEQAPRKLSGLKPAPDKGQDL